MPVAAPSQWGSYFYSSCLRDWFFDIYAGRVLTSETQDLLKRPEPGASPWTTLDEVPII